MRNYVIDKNTKILKFFIADNIEYNLYEDEELIVSEQEFNFYQAKLVNGVFIENLTPEEIEAIEDAKIPTKLRNFQVREALIEMGIMPTLVDAEIEKLESPDKDIVSQMWNFRDEISRKNPYVIQLADALDIDLKQLFTIGNQIN
jgi:hypothetical protein